MRWSPEKSIPLLLTALVASSCGGGGPSCPTGQTLCKSSAAQACADLMSDSSNCGVCGHACPTGQACANGACAVACPTGSTACNGLCVDPQSDDLNCGACGNACPMGNVCAAGKCTVSCAAGETACGSACTSLKTDSENCGSCGTVCPSGQICNGMGACAETCASGYNVCGTSSAAYCAKLMDDGNNCGACGMACLRGNLCMGGVCTTSCLASETDCSGVCTSLKTDNANCGACASPCPSGEVCNGTGTCSETCAAGYTVCGSGATATCAKVATDVNDCGACGNVCPAGDHCVGGACVTSCPATQSACGGLCVSEAIDSRNCGACGNACPSGDLCNGAGVCSTACAAGLSMCGAGAAAFCANLQTDDKNCGTCGTVCGGGLTCTGGKCVMPMSLCGRFSGTTAASWTTAPSSPLASGAYAGFSDYGAAGADGFYLTDNMGNFWHYSSSTGTYGSLPAVPNGGTGFGGFAWIGTKVYDLADPSTTGTTGALMAFDTTTATWSTIGSSYNLLPATQVAHDDAGNVWSFASLSQLIEINPTTGMATYATLSTPLAAGGGAYSSEGRIAFDSCTQTFYLADYSTSGFYSWSASAGEKALTGLPGGGNFGDGFCSDRSGHVYDVPNGGTTVYQYTTSTAAWSAVPLLPATLASCTACTVGGDGGLYVTDPCASTTVYRLQLN